jgi:hypothetical protein
MTTELLPAPPNPALDHTEYVFLADGCANAFDQLLRYALACHDLGDDTVLADLAARNVTLAQRMGIEIASIEAAQAGGASAKA